MQERVEAVISQIMVSDEEANATLVRVLNALLEELALADIQLEVPSDLTPSLLLALLESLLRERIPISQAARDSKTPNSRVEAMKVFLGVLANDVLTTSGFGQSVVEEVSEIDPRRLASGETEECFMVGEVLCRLAKERGFLASLSETAPDVSRRSPEMEYTTSSLPKAPSPFNTPPKPAHRGPHSSMTHSRTVMSPTTKGQPSPTTTPPAHRIHTRASDALQYHSSPSSSPTITPPSSPPESKLICIHDLKLTPPTSPSAHIRSLTLFDDPIPEFILGSDPKPKQSPRHHKASHSYSTASPSASPSNSHSVCTCDLTMTSEADTSLFCTCGHTSITQYEPTSLPPSPSPATSNPLFPLDLTQDDSSSAAGSNIRREIIDGQSHYADPTNIRYGQHISVISPDEDIEEFERSSTRPHRDSRPSEQNLSFQPRFPWLLTTNGHAPGPTRHTARSEYTLALLRERARLYSELSRLRH